MTGPFAKSGRDFTRTIPFSQIGTRFHQNDSFSAGGKTRGTTPRYDTARDLGARFQIAQVDRVCPSDRTHTYTLFPPSCAVEATPTGGTEEQEVRDYAPDYYLSTPLGLDVPGLSGKPQLTTGDNQGSNSYEADFHTGRRTPPPRTAPSRPPNPFTPAGEDGVSTVHSHFHPG